MGCTQPVTPMQSDKFTVNNILNNTVIRKQLKAMDMRFYWIQYQIKQDHFLVFWKLVMANRENIYQTSPAAPPQRNVANIHPYRGYHKEIFFEGVFITCSYSNASLLQHNLHTQIQQEQHSQITSHSELIHKQTG